MVKKSKEDNPMRSIEIDKLVINCCVGEAGDKLTKAVKVLKDLSGQEPVTNEPTCLLTGETERNVNRVGSYDITKSKALNCESVGVTLTLTTTVSPVFTSALTGSSRMCTPSARTTVPPTHKSAARTPIAATNRNAGFGTERSHGGGQSRFRATRVDDPFAKIRVRRRAPRRGYIVSRECIHH